jgi:hypothetical protein
MRRMLWVIGFSVLVLPAAALGQGTNPATETSCTDRVDNDKDGLTDCGDADCFDNPVCKPDGQPENTDKRCSDWVDNDKDGHADCEDNDCKTSGVTVCKGSWKGNKSNGKSTGGGSDAKLPKLGPGQTVEDLIGTHGDKDGERNDVLCSDGEDNDNDGKTDCADFGCRFDPTVTVCRGNPNIRFSVVGNIAVEYDFVEERFDTRFSKLQLRAFGPMPYIQDSFFLVSMRAEKTPRLTFAMFQIPLGAGHFLNINSGGGGLSNALVLSSAKQLLLNPAYYMYSAFEQGNGAAAEVYGPLTSSGRMRYRAYIAGGSGLFAGNVGGRYFSFNNDNFTWGGGAAIGINIIGQYSRWDSQFMYTSAPTTLAITAGAKYDQRAQERYVAFNARLIMRWKWFAVATENYTKRELEFGSWQTAYNVQLGVLIWPKHMLLGADFGEYIPGDMDNPPETFQTELRRQLTERQWRVALHWYFWRNVGVASLLYHDRTIESNKLGEPPTDDRGIRLEVQYRF